MPNYVRPLCQVLIKSVNAFPRYGDTVSTQNGRQSAILIKL